ncbi:MAG: tRNA epoxyqueuosine(34) reductase QueG [Anaerolinea sp.]|nr:tRNA epoxyqueuosine(34) reductase QueG [Anaerolinea sp.]
METLQNDKVNLEGKIRAEAIRLGFSLCGFTSPETPIEFERYEKWLNQGRHSSMTYLDTARHRTMRQHPEHLVPGVKTIISLGWPYALNQTKDNPSTGEALIAGYAAGKDYHLFLPTKLDQLVSFMQKEIDPNIHAQSFSDSAPILERELASRAGLGWIGKNACLISPEIGSAFLLSELFIDFQLQPDLPFATDRCGTCHRCLDACPTACIQQDRTIDSNQCISYLTIENKGSIPEGLRPSLAKWLFGCDICQTVCPWNQKNSLSSSQTQIQNWSKEKLLIILSISPEEFSKLYKETALNRTKLKGLQRNALVWLGNNGEPEMISCIESFLWHTTDVDLIESANWAIRMLKTHFLKRNRNNKKS